MNRNRRSITAFCLYIVGFITLVIALMMLNDPKVETYSAGLIGLLLSFVLGGLGRACDHLSRIRDILEGKS